MKKVLLIDGNNILFRSYYATSYSGVIMRNSKGFPTNALYGLINMLNKIINEEKPTHIMVALDKGKTFRHDKYESYKAGRKAMPEDLKLQFPVAKEIINAMGIKYFEINNYEADDIIGTFAKQVELDDDFIGTIISSDKDLLQLISDEVDVKLLKTNDYIRMNKQVFKDTYKVDPIHMIDLKALMGDQSDNIPGVKGIGEKTAISLLEKYQTIDNLYNNIDNITGKTKEKLLADKGNCYMSLDLATICKNVPIDTNLENVEYTGIDNNKYIELLKKLEFFSILKKLDIKETIEKKETKKIDPTILTDLSNITLKNDYSIYIEILGKSYHKDESLGLGIYNEEISYYIPFNILKKYPKFLNDNLNKYTYDYKRLKYILNKNNIEINNCVFDTMVASYIVNDNTPFDISVLAVSMGYDLNLFDSIYGSGVKLNKPEESIIASECVNKAKFIYDSKKELEEKIEKDNSMYLFKEIEMKLIDVLCDMELTGIKIDKNYLEKMGEEIKEKLDNISNEIYILAGEKFNINSPKQLGDILFNKLNIPYPKKIKEDKTYATSKEILDKISKYNPIVEKILIHRTLSKLYANYVVGLINEIEEDGRIHTTFNQTLTRTGRLSSESPNLQNIPVRLEYGRLIRKGFVPDDNSLLLSSDYSQIELRMFAHISNADNLKQAFIEDKDIHTKTAADIFHVDESMVTKDMRRQAKAVNFGIIYGISSFGLSEDLKIDFSSAKMFIDSYLETFPGIKEYMDKTKEDAYKNGYVKTVMNRKRNIEELKSKNFMLRQTGERMALNTPIQGSSADILKKAMIEIYNEFKERKLKSKMLIQVHDELIFNVVKEELEEVQQIVKTKMENTYKLSVPLKVDIEIGDTWYEAK